MNKEEFMRQLEQLLIDVSEEEKKEALEYYRGYFEDAGEENEERILRELESPEKVAQTIKSDLEMGKDAHTEQQPQGETIVEKVRNNDNTGKIILIVILAVLTFPVWIGIVAGLFGVCVGIFGGLFGISIAAAAVTGALYISGATVFGVGISQLVIGNIATGIAMMGAGCLLVALAILLTVACVWLYGRFIPWLIRGIVSLCRRIFAGKGRAA